MDGTLLDSMQSANRVWGRWAQSVGVSSFELVGGAHGRVRPDIIRALLPNATDAEIAAHSEAVRIGERDDVEDITAISGARELLDSLYLDHWAIATSCDAEVALARLAAAGLPVPKVLVSADDVTNGKPHPEPYLKAADRLGFDPANCVVFEDAPAGLASAKAAGMRSVANRHTQRDENLTDALVIIDDLRSVECSIDAAKIRLRIG